MENYLQEKMQAELLKYAAGRQMFCPNCDKVLDWKTTAIVAVFDREGRSDSRTYCTTCVGEEARAKFYTMVHEPKFNVAKVEIDTRYGTETWDEAVIGFKPEDLGEQTTLEV